MRDNAGTREPHSFRRGVTPVQTRLAGADRARFVPDKAKNGGAVMPTITVTLARRMLLVAVALLLIATTNAYSEPAPMDAATIPPIPPGRARIWIYRDYQPSESLNMTAVSINGAVTGYAQAAGGVFYRDVAPGQYLVSVESYGRDTNQSTNLVLAAGQEAYIKIESLRAWSSTGARTSIQRDTFYARPIAPRLARVEMAHIPYYGGG
jgi:Protein of unknown function (DUF2846)